MSNSGKMLGPRQLNPFGPGPITQDPQDPAPTTFPPGPVDPPPTAVANPSLPLSIEPISTSPGTAASPTGEQPTTMSSSNPTLTVPSDPSESNTGTASLTISSVSAVPTQSSGTGSSPTWTLFSPTNATTCQPLPIHWDVSNLTSTDLSNTHIELVITNTGLNPNATDLILVTDQQLLNNTYLWPAVTVPAGVYSIQGIVTDGSGRTEQSSTFSVQTGPDTSCLSSPGSQGTNAPSSQSHHSNTAAIAGGTIGGLVLLTCVGVALFFLCGLRKNPRAKNGQRAQRGWGGLDSVDSKASRSRRAVPGDSNDYLSAGRGRDSALGIVAQPREGSSSSLEGEKVVRESVRSSAGGLPVLTRHSSWSTANIFETESVGHASPPSVELARLSGRSHAAADSPRSSSDFGDPFVSTPNTSNRRSSRTPRKPVPAYEPTAEELNALAIARSRSDQSHTRSTVSQHPSSSFRSPTSFSHQPSSSLSSSAASHHGDVLLHGLKSKSSGHFDGQPMHYLIPDMPSAPPAD